MPFVAVLVALAFHGSTSDPLTPTCCFIHSMDTDFERVIDVPTARLRMICANIPKARETPNKTV